MFLAALFSVGNKAKSNGRGRADPRYLFRDTRANRALLGGMQQGIQRSPNLGLIFESAQANHGWFGMDSLDYLFDGVDQQIWGTLHDPAVENDHLGIEHTDDIGYRNAQYQKTVFDQGLRLRIALTQRFKNISCVAGLRERSAP